MIEDRKTAWLLFSQGRLEDAYRIAGHLLVDNSQDAETLLLQGLISARLQRFDEAEVSLTASLQLEKTYQALLSLGQLYLVKGDKERALESLEEAISSRPDGHEALVMLGDVYANMGRYPEALGIYRQLDSAGLANACIHGKAAFCHEALRQGEEARKYAVKALESEPEQAMANLVLSRLDRIAGRYVESISRLEQVPSLKAVTVDAANLQAELGQACDRAGFHQKAFRCFLRSNEIWQQLSGDLRGARNFYPDRIERLQQYLHDDAGKSANSKAGENLVFLVGFPRSGTTLIEEILGTCNVIATTQEEPLIPRMIAQLEQSDRNHGEYPGLLACLTDQEIDQLRSGYLLDIRRVTATSWPAPLFVDKLPLNIIDAGFIHRLFPAARFLVALRDPRDVCLSCFMQTFRLNQAMVHFLDLQDTARFYAASMALWQQYKLSLGSLKFLEYRYEDLVTDFDSTTKRILNFLDIEWSPDIGRYHEKLVNKVINTPSYNDVASPLYSRAIGRWRHYHREMSPIGTILQPYVDAFGYDEL